MTTTTATTRDPSEAPGVEATLRSLDGPVFGFAVQPHLSELAAATRSDRARVDGVSLSYTYYRHPLNRAHPSNFVDLTPQQVAAIERAESSRLPSWMVEQIRQIRYPTLWDAVRTAKAGPGDRKDALETRLAAHANDVLRARDPRHVPVRSPRATPTGRLHHSDLLETTCVMVDREPHRGRRLEAAPFLTAFGVRIGKRYLTVVYDTRTAPKLSLEFTVRRPDPENGPL